MKYIILLSCLISPLHAQVRNCQAECPIEYETNTDVSYKVYQQRQSCLSTCEQSNNLHRQIQEQEDELRYQQEEIKQMSDQLLTTP